MKPQAPAAPVALRPPRVALCRVFLGRENSMDVDLPKMPWKMSIFCFTSTFRDMSEIENLSVWWRRMAVNALFWCAVNMNVPIISEGCVCLGEGRTVRKLAVRFLFPGLSDMATESIRIVVGKQFLSLTYYHFCGSNHTCVGHAVEYCGLWTSWNQKNAVEWVCARRLFNIGNFSTKL